MPIDRITNAALQTFVNKLPEPEDIINAVKGKEIELAVMLAIWLSLRMSEIRGLRRSDISPDGVLTINNVMVRSVDGDVLKTETKTYDSRRKLKIPRYIMNLISQTTTEFIVPFKANYITNHFRAALADANVPKMRFHDLRHLNASVMLRLGIPDKYAMERGGWSTPAVMKGIYQHTFSAERIETDRKIDDYFNTICHEI